MKEEALLEQREETIELLALYEQTLSSSQRDVLSAYFRYDLSLGEIAEEGGVSRAAVYDSLRKGIAKLRTLERQIGFLGYRKRLEAKAQASLESGGSALTDFAKEITQNGI